MGCHGQGLMLLLGLSQVCAHETLFANGTHALASDDNLDHFIPADDPPPEAPPPDDTEPVPVPADAAKTWAEEKARPRQ